MIATRSRRPSYRQGFARFAGESAYPHLWRGKIGHWVPTLGTTGTVLRDVSGFSNHLTLTNMAPGTDWVISHSPKVKGYALDFDGSNDHLKNTNVAGNIYDPFRAGGTGVLSLSMWLKRNGNGAKFLLHGASTAAINGWAFIFNSSNLISFATNGVKSYDSSVAITGTGWEHVACTYDKTFDVRHYHNGAFTNLVTHTAAGTTSGNQLYVGARSQDLAFPFPGQMNDIRIYNRLLTPREIQTLYSFPMIDLQPAPGNNYKAPPVLRRMVTY